MKKRALALALVLSMTFGLTACGNGNSTSQGSNGGNTTTAQADSGSGETAAPSQAGAAGEAKTPQDFKKFKIGVMESQSNDSTVLRRNYYENYIAPRYNVEFVFSEQVKSAEDEMNFIEN